MAKTLIEEDLRMNIVINGDKGKKEIHELEEKIGGLNKKLDANNAKLKDLERSGKAGSKQYETLRGQADKLTASIGKENEKLQSLYRQQKNNTMTMSELQHHIRLTSIELKNTDPKSENWSKLNNELRNAKNRFRELSQQSNQTEGFLKRLWNSAAGGVAIVTAFYHGAVRAVQGIARVVGKIADFEQANANLATILGKSVQEINGLTQSALRLGRTTEYTASQVTLLQTELAKLGFGEDQILAMEEPVLHFATAVGAELPEAASLAGATLRIFDLRAADTEDVLGALAVATNKSALNFSYLQTAMSIVGPVANTFGIDVKDTTALLGSLADAGFDASSAATATRNILLNLANANGKLAKEIGKPVKTFPELIQAMQDLDAKGLDLAKTLDLTDKRSVSAFNRFLKGADSANALREALEDTDGELERIANERMNTLQGSVKLLQSAWEGFILSMRGSTGVVKWVVDFITKALSGLTRAFFPEADISARADEMKKTLIDDYKELGETWTEVELEAKKKAAEARIETAKAVSITANPGETPEELLARTRKAKKELKDAERDYQALLLAEQQYRAQVANDVLDEELRRNADGGGGDGNEKETWSLQNDRTFLEAKLELTRQYNDGEIENQEAYNAKILELEIATLTARLALRKESGTDRLQLEQQLLDKTRQQQENAKKKEEQLAKDAAQIIAEIETDAVKKAQGQENKRYAEEQEKYQDNATMLEWIEKRHQAAMAKIRVDGENAWLKREQEQHELERKQIENSYTEQIVAAKTAGEEAMLKREMAAALAALDKSYLEDLRNNVQAIVDSGEFDGIALTDEQKREFEKKLADIIAQINAADSALKGEDRTKRGIGGGSLFGVAQTQWEQLFRNIREGKLGIEDLQIALNGLGGAAQEGFQLASQAIAMTNAKEQEELKAYQKANDTKREDLQKRLNAGLMTQAQYDAEIEKMEAEQEAREEEMALRQAEREKRMNIAQAIINTALSVTKTFTQFGWPAGVAPAAIMGAIGAAQVAMMAATPVTGREEGGFFDADGRPVRVRRKQDGRSFPARLSPDRRGFIDRPTVLVGENGMEYVIPAEALQNPSVAPFVDAIETARRSGRLRDLRLEAVQPRLAVAGRASGGFFADDAAADAGGSVTMPDGTRLSATNYQELLQLLRRMNVIFSKPLKAEVTMLCRNGIVEKTEEYNRTRGRGQLG